MDNTANKSGVTRRDFFTQLAKRALAEVKAGYEEGLAAQLAKASKPQAPR